MTKDEWKWVKPRLTIGCTFRLDSNDNTDWAIGVIKENETPGGWIKFHLMADFSQSNSDWVSNWDYYNYIAARIDDVSNFTWPNGSPIVPFVEYNGQPYNPILSKIKSLETRFKNKKLVKCKMKALPLPT